jgi:outer membrane protein OmpA-like peptidoglycan-associated protein
MRETLDVGEPEFEFWQNLEHTFCLVLRAKPLTKLRKDLQPQGFNENSIRPDPRDRNAIFVIVPGDLMNFETQKTDLQEAGKNFLRSHIPALAEVLCSNQFRSSIDSIVVEGHTDKQIMGERLKRAKITISS